MAFYVIYCARPQDYIPVLSYLPMAKISTVLAAGSLVFGLGRTPRHLKDLPKEATYLLWLIVLLFGSAILSPVWRGGAFFSTLDFSKVYVVWIMSFLLVTTHRRLRRLVFIQTSSVVIISIVAIWKGYSVPRLNGVIGGFYSNPNDLAFGIVLSLPFCLVFLMRTRDALRKVAWGLAMMAMAVTLFMTASRAGFIDLAVSGAVCLWHVGIKGKRHSLIIATVLFGSLIVALAGGTLMKRFTALSGEDSDSDSEAYLSYVERKMLMERALDAIVQYPILGVGSQNFTVYSGLWREVHMSYLQIAVEGGLPALFLYLMFLRRGFVNLKRLSRRQDLDSEMNMFVGALRASLIGFIVGACFAPEAYQYFPYFTVCYTSVMVALVEERQPAGIALAANFPQRRLAGAYATGAGVRAFERLH